MKTNAFDPQVVTVANQFRELLDSGDSENFFIAINIDGWDHSLYLSAEHIRQNYDTLENTIYNMIDERRVSAHLRYQAL